MLGYRLKPFCYSIRLVGFCFWSKSCWYQYLWNSDVWVMFYYVYMIMCFIILLIYIHSFQFNLFFIWILSHVNICLYYFNTSKSISFGPIIKQLNLSLFFFFFFYVEVVNQWRFVDHKTENETKTTKKKKWNR